MDYGLPQKMLPVTNTISDKSSPPDVFLEKGVLKVYCKFTGQYSWQSVISIKLQSNFIVIALRHRCSPVNLLYVSRTPLYKNNHGGLLLI